LRFQRDKRKRLYLRMRLIAPQLQAIRQIILHLDESAKSKGGAFLA